MDQKSPCTKTRCTMAVGSTETSTIYLERMFTRPLQWDKFKEAVAPKGLSFCPEHFSLEVRDLVMALLCCVFHDNHLSSNRSRPSTLIEHNRVFHFLKNKGDSGCSRIFRYTIRVSLGTQLSRHYKIIDSSLYFHTWTIAISFFFPPMLGLCIGHHSLSST